MPNAVRMRNGSTRFEIQILTFYSVRSGRRLSVLIRVSGIFLTTFKRPREAREMAMVTRTQRIGENATHHPVTKGLFKPEAAKPRAALGTISNNVTERNAFLVKQKPQVVKEHHETVVEKPPPPVKAETIDIESPMRAMELGADEVIEDIDAFDIENPQLCCEYVKDIYKYMEKLEVSC